VSEAESQRKPLADLPLETLRGFAQPIEDDVYEYLTAGNVVKRYQPDGAGGADQLSARLARWKETLS
jgi:argininosuccinate lyase